MLPGPKMDTYNKAQTKFSMEMRYLRKIAGVTGRGKIRNKVIKERTGIESILNYI